MATYQAERSARIKTQLQAELRSFRLDADAAQQDARAAREDARAAREDARAALEDADAAQTRADAAREDADAAQTRADAAQKRADDANKRANTAADALDSFTEATSTLAAAPAWPVVGNVTKLAPALADKVLRDCAGNRDELPFYYVMNPPRHGKSLLLDRIATECNAHGAGVVGVTYNGAFPVAEWEHQSAKHAIDGLRVRIMFASAGVSRPCNWNQWDLLAPKLSGSRMLEKMLTTAPNTRLVVLVDEITNLTDKLSRDQRKALWEAMFNMMVSGFRFVMTGFNPSPAKSLQTSSFTWSTQSLEQCEPDVGKELGQILFHAHARLGAPFPHFAYEVCKSTPGLLGTLLWSMQTHGPIPCELSKIRSIPWVGVLHDNAEKYWQRVYDVFVSEKPQAAMAAAETDELTVRRGACPELSPFAVAVVVEAMSETAVPATCRAVFGVLKSCIAHCRRRTVRTSLQVTVPVVHEQSIAAICDRNAVAESTQPLTESEPSGSVFEMFTADAIALRMMSTVAEPDVAVEASKAVKVLPLTDELLFAHVYFLETRERIVNLIGALPYRLFPCGFELLCTTKPRDGKSPASSTSPCVEMKLSRHPLPSAYTTQAESDPFIRKGHLVEVFPGTFPTTNESKTDLNKALESKPDNGGSVSRDMVRCASSARALRQLILDRMGTRANFVLVPSQSNNPLCDVIAVSFEPEEASVHVSLVECRDRRHMSMEDWVAIPLALGSRLTAIPYLVRTLKENGIDTTVHLILAGRCESTATLDRIERALAAGGTVATGAASAAAPDDEE
jgi:hypothetical protein